MHRRGVRRDRRSSLHRVGRTRLRWRRDGVAAVSAGGRDAGRVLSPLEHRRAPDDRRRRGRPPDRRPGPAAARRSAPGPFSRTSARAMRGSSTPWPHRDDGGLHVLSKHSASANAELAERLTSLAGPGLERAHLASGGSEAVETAIKLLRVHAVATGQPERKSGHLSAAQVPRGDAADPGAERRRRRPVAVGTLAVMSEKVPAPLTFRAPSPEAAADAKLRRAPSRRRRLGPERVLAIVMEPVRGQASGANVPTPSFARRTRAVRPFRHPPRLRRDRRAVPHGSVPGGAPRSRVVAGVVNAGEENLAAGYAPLGAALFSGALVEEVAATAGFSVSHSYDANPIACAAGSAVLGEVAERGLVDWAATLGLRLRAGLGQKMASTAPLIGDVRGRRLLIGLELVSDRGDQRPVPRVRRPGRDRAAPRARPRPAPLLAPPERGALRRLAARRATTRHRRADDRQPGRTPRGDLQRSDGRESLSSVAGAQEREPLRVVTTFSRSRLAPGQTLFVS